MDVIKEQYIQEINRLYDIKLKQEKEIRERTLLSNSQYKFTLQDIYLSTERKSQAKLQNIINSIPLIHQDKILLFKTITLNPSININLNNFNKNTIEQQYNLQNQTFKQYQREFRRIKDKNYIYIFEITKKLNFHQHQISYLNTIIDIKNYIKHTFIAKSKNEQIGRIELKFDYKIKEQILKLFDNFKIKTYGKLTLKSFTDYKTKEKFYKIIQSQKSRGNFIKIAFIEEQTLDDNKYIEKYLFKYLLKQKIKDSDEFVDSLDSKICNVYGINQLTFSENFFYDKISSKILFKLNDKLYSIKKYLNIDIDNNLNLYHAIEFLKNNDIYLADKIYYIKNKDEDIILLDINKTNYTKQISTCKFTALYNKYKDNEIQITKKEVYIYLATQMFFICNYDTKEIQNIYDVDTIEDLAQLLQLKNDLYEEEQQNLKQKQMEETISQTLCLLEYQLEQVRIESFMIEADIFTINLIKNKINSIENEEINIIF